MRKKKHFCHHDCTKTLAKNYINLDIRSNILCGEFWNKINDFLCTMYTVSVQEVFTLTPTASQKFSKHKYWSSWKKIAFCNFQLHALEMMCVPMCWYMALRIDETKSNFIYLIQKNNTHTNSIQSGEYFNLPIIYYSSRESIL